MGCCCKKGTKKTKQCCVCNPFDQDKFLMTAQIASIVAATISWVWWPTFVVSAPLVAVLQITWCCRMKKAGLIAACVLAFVAFVLALTVGIWMTQKCGWGIFVVMLNHDDNDYTYIPPPPTDDYYYSPYVYDYTPHCYNYVANPTAWVVVTFVDCALYLLTFVSATYFTLRRYDEKAAQWEQSCGEEDEDEMVVPVVEMGVVNSFAPEARATIMGPDEKDLDQA